MAYIEREVAIKYLENHKKVAKERNFILAADEDAIIKFLREKCPAADVVEVRHGEWVLEYGDYGEMICSVCKKTAQTERKPDHYEDFQITEFYIESPYCPNCGAKMDGKGEGE